MQLRQLLLDIVKLFQTQNFKLIANVNFRGSTDSLFFESRVQSFGLATPEEMFAVSLNRVDRLRLVASNSDLQHNVGSLIQQTWARGIQQVITIFYRRLITKWRWLEVSFDVCNYFV